MSKKFVNNKFNGAINGKRCKDYYKESKKYGTDLYNQIEIAKEILGIEEIKRRIAMDYYGKISQWD